MKRILMVRMGAMGDIVHALPSAASLRAAYPDAEIDWLVESHWSPLLEGNPHVTNIWKLQKRDAGAAWRMIQQLRERRYDTVIDFQGLIKSAVIAGFAGAAEVIGFSMEALREKLAAAAYTRAVRVPAGLHVVEQYLTLAAAAGAEDRVYEFPLPAGDCSFTGDYMAVSPSAGWAAKIWPAEKFSELIGRVKRELGWTTIINCGPGEETLARSLGGEVASGGIAALIGMARRARVFVAGDTGPLHIAAAVGTPVVAIFGPTDPVRNGPFSKRARVVRAADVSTTYARSASNADTARVSVDDVLAAIKEVA